MINLLVVLIVIEVENIIYMVIGSLITGGLAWLSKKSQIFTNKINLNKVKCGFVSNEKFLTNGLSSNSLTDEWLEGARDIVEEEVMKVAKMQIVEPVKPRGKSSMVFGPEWTKEITNYSKTFEMLVDKREVVEYKMNEELVDFIKSITTIDDKFFTTGKVVISKSTISIPFANNPPSYSGNEFNVAKYQALENLDYIVDEINDLSKMLYVLNEYSPIYFAVDTRKFDEHLENVDLTLVFNHSDILRDFSTVVEGCELESAAERMEELLRKFRRKSNTKNTIIELHLHESYVAAEYIPPHSLLGGSDTTERIKDAIIEMYSIVNNFELLSDDTICIKLPKLKRNTLYVLEFPVFCKRAITEVSYVLSPENTKSQREGTIRVDTTKSEE